MGLGVVLEGDGRMVMGGLDVSRFTGWFNGDGDGWYYFIKV